jgi:hypothetical protein
VLLALVAVASRGDRPVFGANRAAREPTTAFWDYLVSVSLAVGLLGVAITIWALATRRARGFEDRRGLRFFAILFVSALLIGAAIGPRSADFNLWGNRNDSRGDSGRAAPGPAAAQADRQQTPELQWLPVVLLVGGGLAIAVGLEARRRARLRRRARPTDTQLVDELAALLDDTLEDLRAEPDPRRAVIAAYARMERALAAYGLPRRAFEAPLEYLDRIAAPLHERLSSARRLVFELTHLFERAKFSVRAVDAEMKDDAIETLAELRDELRREEEAA